MKSLWSFMREKHLTEAIRCSLENFGSFSHTDKEDRDTARHVSVIPPLCRFANNKNHDLRSSVNQPAMDFMLYNYPSA